MHGKRECVFCKNTENLIPLGNRMGYVCANCRTLWNTEDGDFLEHGSPSIGHIADYALGHMTENLFMVGNVCVPDLFITGEGEVRYKELIRLLCDHMRKYDPACKNPDKLLAATEPILAQIDLLMNWGMTEAIKLGMKLGQDPAAVKILEEAEN